MLSLKELEALAWPIPDIITINTNGRRLDQHERDLIYLPAWFWFFCPQIAASAEEALKKPASAFARKPQRLSKLGVSLTHAQACHKSSMEAQSRFRTPGFSRSGMI
eukprot:scaffold486739_cov19-Prasinocladus_malaysianus.AAC.1